MKVSREETSHRDDPPQAERRDPPVANDHPGFGAWQNTQNTGNK